MQLIRKLWKDEEGAVNSIELILIASIVVIGLVVGLATLRDSVVQELGDAALAIGQLNQSYSMTTDLDGTNGAPITRTATFEFGTATNPTPPPATNPRVIVNVEVFDSNFTDNNDAFDHVGGGGVEGSGVIDQPNQAPAGIIQLNVTTNEEEQ